MTFKQFVNNAKLFLKDNPEVADLDVIYSCDDEGNSYHKVYYSPSKGYLKNSEFEIVGDDTNLGVNAVCIN